MYGKVSILAGMTPSCADLSYHACGCCQMSMRCHAQAQATLRQHCIAGMLQGRRRLHAEVLAESVWEKTRVSPPKQAPVVDPRAAMQANRDANLFRTAPVWDNGETLVGRDVPPVVGMRVLMSRQYRQYMHNTGHADPSGGLGGTVIRLLAGSENVGPSFNVRDSCGVGNGKSCKVCAHRAAWFLRIRLCTTPPCAQSEETTWHTGQKCSTLTCFLRMLNTPLPPPPD